MSPSKLWLPENDDVAPALSRVGVSGDNATTSSALTGGMRACIRRTTAQSINNNSITQIIFDAIREEIPAGAFFDPAFPTRLKFPVAGLWNVGATLRFAAAATGTQRFVALRPNGAGTAFVANQSFPGAGTVRVSLSRPWNFLANEFVELQAFQDSGAALNVEAAPPLTAELYAYFVSP